MATADLPPPYPGKDVTSSDSDSLRSCPNGCQSGALTKGQLKEHLLDCPLELVECEFSTAGCNERVLRRDRARHMTENAQQHLMSATLLNLQQTRELCQKMEEKEQQIADLQRQVQRLPTTNGFVRHNFILSDFTACQRRSPTGEWYSKVLTDGMELIQVQLKIDTNGIKPGLDHMTASLHCLHYDSKTDPKRDSSFDTVVVILHMLNQLGDSGHYVVSNRTRTRHLEKPVKLTRGEEKDKYFPLAGLGLNSTTRTQYLLNDTLHFKLYLRIDLE